MFFAKRYVIIISLLELDDTAHICILVSEYHDTHFKIYQLQNNFIDQC